MKLGAIIFGVMVGMNEVWSGSACGLCQLDENIESSVAFNTRKIPCQTTQLFEIGEFVSSDTFSEKLVTTRARSVILWYLFSMGDGFGV